MNACRAETGIMDTAGTVPDPATEALRVRILRTSGNAAAVAPERLLKERSLIGTVFSGTDLRQLLELPEVATKHTADPSQSAKDVAMSHRP